MSPEAFSQHMNGILPRSVMADAKRKCGAIRGALRVAVIPGVVCFGDSAATFGTVFHAHDAKLVTDEFQILRIILWLFLARPPLDGAALHLTSSLTPSVRNLHPGTPSPSFNRFLISSFIGSQSFAVPVSSSAPPGPFKSIW